MAQWDKIGSRGRVSDRRGMGRTGGIGLLGFGLVLAVAYFGGGEQAVQVYDVLQTVNQQQGPAGEQSKEFEGEDAYEVFASQVLGVGNDLWTKELEQQGITYREPELVLFRGGTESACGGATSTIGPHYCPADETIYLDETFFDELQKRFGARGGDVAEAYVIAHEIGHHVQNVTGSMRDIRTAQARSPQDANEFSVTQELQADCFAGVWAHSLRGQGIFAPGEIEEAIDAAEAVGDDNIQHRTHGTIDEESWTHGSSQERKKAFVLGYNQGSYESCLRM